MNLPFWLRSYIRKLKSLTSSFLKFAVLEKENAHLRKLSLQLTIIKVRNLDSSFSFEGLCLTADIDSYLLIEIANALTPWTKIFKHIGVSHTSFFKYS